VALFSTVSGTQVEACGDPAVGRAGAVGPMAAGECYRFLAVGGEQAPFDTGLRLEQRRARRHLRI
jgi:hypothetical protein